MGPEQGVNLLRVQQQSKRRGPLGRVRGPIGLVDVDARGRWRGVREGEADRNHGAVRGADIFLFLSGRHFAR